MFPPDIHGGSPAGGGYHREYGGQNGGLSLNVLDDPVSIDFVRLFIGMPLGKTYPTHVQYTAWYILYSPIRVRCDGPGHLA